MVDGLVAHPLTLSLAQIVEMPAREQIAGMIVSKDGAPLANGEVLAGNDSQKALQACRVARAISFFIAPTVSAIRPITDRST